jgi:hypothetical protein
LNEFPDHHYFDNSISHNLIRWIKFEKKDITKFRAGKYLLVEIEVYAQVYQYKLLLEGRLAKAETKEELYKKLNFADGALAIEDAEPYGKEEGAFVIHNKRYA